MIWESVTSEIQEREPRRNVFDDIQKIEEGKPIGVLVIRTVPAKRTMDPKVFLSQSEAAANLLQAVSASSGRWRSEL